MAAAVARVRNARLAAAGGRIREREMVRIVVKDARSGRTTGEEGTTAAEREYGGAGRAS
jgi:hypothetical protein